MSRRGNIVVTLLFVLLLSFSGLALLTHSLLHSRIGCARQGRWRIAAGLEASLVLQLHRYRQLLESSDMNRFADPGNDFFNTANFPDTSVGNCLVKNLFRLGAPADSSGFSRIRIFNRLTAVSSKSRLAYRAQASVDLLAGDVPLNEFALLLTGDVPVTQSPYLSVKGVEWTGAAIAPAGRPLLAGDCRQVLAESLRLPAPLPDWRQIREKFKLEPADAPIAPGIYLALSAGLVETVFVEGDLQRLGFGARDGRQTILFQLNGHRAELNYRPGQESLSWSGPETVNGCRFAEKIFVHGNIWAIEQSGEAAFAAGSCIQVLASGQMRLNTGLAAENLDLQKTKFANLLLMTSDRDFFSGEKLNADIVLAPDAGSTIEAHLLAAGKVVHGAGLVKVRGSLVAGDVRNSGCLRLDPLAGHFDLPARLRVQNFKCLQNFQVHFIMENDDE